MKVRKLLGFVLIAILINIFSSVPVQADPPPVNGSVTITATVPDCTVTFSGYAPKNSTITFKDSGSVIGTTTANTSGVFTKTIVSTPGSHDFSMYATDTAGRTTPETFFSGVNLINQTDNPINNIHLPPTIALSKSSIYKGETVSVFGHAAPGSTVHVFVNGVEKYTAAVPTGDWQYTFGQSVYVVGSNSIYAYLTRSGLPNSVNSSTKTLTVSNCKRSDLNCDTFVNLTDFSILLFHWGGNNALADTNDDGKVGLIDFSIMLFDWTG